MKLEDIKDKIDSFFDNISEEEFYNLITTKYNMPVVYEIDMPSGSSASDGVLYAELDDIDYNQTYNGDISISIFILNPSQPVCEMMGNDSTCLSYSLSFAA